MANWMGREGDFFLDEDPFSNPFYVYPPYPPNDSSLGSDWAGNYSGNETGITNGGSPPSFNALALAVLLASFSVATVCGNSLVILAVARERYLHSVTNYFITSLAVADCLVGLVVMPFQAIFETLGKTWIFGEFWCDLWHSLDVLASTSSILHLSVISLDRYWAITDPFSYPSRMTNTRACVLIGLIWICSSLISFPAILWWRAVRAHPIQDLTCPFTNDLYYLVFSSIISFYGPLVLMVFTYYRIYKAAVEQTRSLKLGSKLCTDGDVELTLRIHRGGGPTTTNFTSQPTPPSELPRSQPRLLAGGRQNSDDESEIGQISLLNSQLGHNGTSPRNSSVRVVPKNLKNFSISRKLAKFAKEKKAAKTLGIVMGVFIVCCLCGLPFFVTNLLSGFCSTCLNEAELVTDIATWLGWINSGMNPVIYACWSRDFRRAFGRLLCACCPSRIRKQYRPGGLRPRLARLTQSMSLMTASMIVTGGPRTRDSHSSFASFTTSTSQSRGGSQQIHSTNHHHHHHKR